jgi:PAS domain S-box-containing protein
MADYFPKLPKNRQILIVLLPIFILAYAGLVVLYYQKTEAYAISEAHKAAQDVLLTHKAVHRYVTEIQRPEIYRLKETGHLYQEYFSPKVMSFTFIARSVKELINKEREKIGLPLIYFKLAADNPRNPINQADVYESALLARMNQGEVNEIREVVQQNGEPTLHLAVPIDRSSKGCLKCHGDPNDAPAELIALYGSERGFYESPNSIRALISIRVSLAPSIREANEIARLISLITLLIMATIYALIYFFILRIDREQRAVIASTRITQETLENMVDERTAALAQTEARASHILQSSADGLYGVDRDGKITFINPAGCQLLGCTVEQVIGHSAHALFHHSKADGTPYPADECPAYKALRHGHEVRVDNEVYWHADGHPVPVMFAAHPMIQGGQSDGAVISFVDMSEQRAAALARERAIVAAENLARVRSEFLSNMSHEIRTPINGVLGYAEIGYRNCQDAEKARNAFDKIRTSGTRLLGVINDILDFSKIEAGKLHVERTTVALNEVIEQAVDVVQERADAKHLDLRVERASNLPRTCLGDPLRIGQVLLNLLSNAVKFTEAGSITLAASCVDNTLIFRVTDTGIGMNGAQINQLFAPFQQGDGSISRRFGGSGLGLTIAKRIAELMGADIRVESQPDKGSTFEFRLPYIPADDALAMPDPVTAVLRGATDQRLAGITILVAEDEPINQQILELNLTEDGAKVVMVSNGLQAVERILQDGRAAYDIVLMDMQMPELGGLEATQRISELAPNLPIIGQTANAFAEDRDKCLAAGMVGYIAKPFDPEALVSLVLQHVKTRRDE